MNAYLQRNVSLPGVLILAVIAAGTAGTVFGLSSDNPYALVLPPVLVASGMLASLWTRRWIPIRSLSISLPRRLVLSGYFLVASFVLLTYARAPGYERPFITHVLLLGLYVLAALAIYAFESGYSQLSIVILTAVFHRALVYYASATQLGLDALFHNRMAGQIAATGSLLPLAEASSKYWYTPAYHILVGVSSMLSGLSVRDTAFLVITVLAVMLPVFVVYSLLRTWGTRVGALGGLMFVIGDRAISWSVHVTTTTLGLVLFSVVLVAAVRYLQSGSRGYFAVFALALLGQFLNHQVSLFVTAILCGTIVGVSALRQWTGGRRVVLLVGSLLATSIVQTVATKLDGPSGDDSVFEVVISNFRTALSGGGGVPFPDSAPAVLGGSTSLAPVHVFGFAGLFGAAVLGAIYWIDREPTRGLPFGIGTATCVACVFAFALPLVGVTVLFPFRWFPFFYLCLAVLAAPGLVTVLSSLVTLTSKRRRGAMVALVIVLCLVFVPYTIFMTWNYPGAIDGPVFDDSPGAQRLSATTTEAATYEHVAEHGDDRMVVADRAARQMIERHYGQSAVTYQAHHGPPPEPVYTDDVLFVDRSYARTDRASYLYGHQDQWYVVFGSLTVDRSSHSTVYTAGDDRVLHRR